MRRRLAILFVFATAAASMSGLSSCGEAKEDPAEERRREVQQQVQQPEQTLTKEAEQTDRTVGENIEGQPHERLALWLVGKKPQPITSTWRSVQERWCRVGILSTSKQLGQHRQGKRKTIIQRQTDATDRRTDQLLYKLYQLTDEEIEIVEETVRQCAAYPLEQ